MYKPKCIKRVEDDTIYCSLKKNELQSLNKYNVNDFKNNFKQDNYKYYKIEKIVDSNNDKIKLDQINNFTTLEEPISKNEAFKYNQIYVGSNQPKLILIFGAGETIENRNAWEKKMKEIYGNEVYEIYYINNKIIEKHPNVLNYSYPNEFINTPKGMLVIFKIMSYILNKYGRLFDHILIDTPHTPTANIKYIIRYLLNENGIYDIYFNYIVNDVKKIIDESELKTHMQKNIGKTLYDFIIMATTNNKNLDENLKLYNKLDSNFIPTIINNTIKLYYTTADRVHKNNNITYKLNTKDYPFKGEAILVPLFIRIHVGEFQQIKSELINHIIKNHTTDINEKGMRKAVRKLGELYGW